MVNFICCTLGVLYLLLFVISIHAMGFFNPVSLTLLAGGLVGALAGGVL